MVTVTPGTSTAIYWLALSLTPGLGPTRGRKLVQHFGNAQDVFHAALTELESLGLQAHSAFFTFAHEPLHPDRFPSPADAGSDSRHPLKTARPS